MASDSDVEAYLNQLSRKTHRLKQDSQPWENSLSSLSGADHPPSELSASSDLSLQVESREPKTYLNKKAASEGVISDITALSEKYSFSKGKASANKDRFSTLEEKYSKKYNINASLKSHELSKERKQRKNLAEKNEVRDGPATKVDIHFTAKERKVPVNDVNSSEEIDDENLAHYLSEMTLTSEEYVSDKDNNADNSKNDDSIDDVLNLKNVIDIEEILQKEESNGGSLHLSPVLHSAESNDSAGRNISQPESKPAAKSRSDAAEVPKLEQTKASSGKNILSPSKSSLFYSSRQKEDEDENKNHTPIGLLLSQTGVDVFHSSRRKSSVEFYGINEGKVKPTKSSKQNHKRKSKKSHKSASEGSIASASESQIYEQVPGSGQSKDDLSSRVVTSGGTPEPTVASQVEEDSQVSTSAGTVHYERIKQHSISSQTRHSVDLSSPGKSHRKYKKSVSTKDQDSNHRRKSCKQSYNHHHKGRKGQKASHRKRKEIERIPRQSKKKHRSPSSSSSSSSSSLSSSSSSTEPSYSTSESVQHRSRSHKRSRRKAYGYWGEPPFMRHSVWPCCCLHAGHAASAHTLHSFTGASSNVLSGSGLRVEEVMQQQVALVREFLESQQVMQQAYTSTLISSYRYTSLRRTEKYIKKRKPPLTFPEAYRLVKKEMEASER